LLHRLTAACGQNAASKPGPDTGIRDTGIGACISVSPIPNPQSKIQYRLLCPHRVPVVGAGAVVELGFDHALDFVAVEFALEFGEHAEVAPAPFGVEGDLVIFEGGVFNFGGASVTAGHGAGELVAFELEDDLRLERTAAKWHTPLPSALDATERRASQG